jgi:hypothetical protein
LRDHLPIQIRQFRALYWLWAGKGASGRQRKNEGDADMNFSGNPARHLSVLVLTALLGTATAAMAHGPQAEAAPQAPPHTTAQSSRAAANGFDWLARTTRTAPVRVTEVRQVGQGSYICAPAGFGRKSHCYAN